MCGICGIIPNNHTKAGSEPDTTLEFLHHMLRAMHHRGPDAQQASQLPGLQGAAFGHTRLSILDLSENGNQPMFNEDKTVVLVANGEIYNYRELRQELQSRKHHFVSTSDSEVILHAYEEYGTEAFARIRGMYAFALYDQKKEHILLKRDPLGIKPLYICETSAFIAFASEVRALLALPIDRQIDHEAIAAFMMMGCISAPHTHIKAIQALLPGQLVTIQRGQISRTNGNAIRDYIFSAAEAPPPATDTIKACLHDSMQRHLISDAPIGLFLSGGIDSGTLAGLATATGHTNIRGVCVTVPENDMDESRYARLTAQRYGISMQEIPLTKDVFEDSMSQFMRDVDMPTCDGFNTFIVSRAAKQAGFKAAISGVGGDELFAGYPTFCWVPFFTHFSRTLDVFGKRPRALAARLLRSCIRSSAATRVSLLMQQYRADQRISYLAYRGMFVSDVLSQLLVPDMAHAAENAFHRFMETTAWANEPSLPTPLVVAGLEIDRYMQPMLLRDADNFSMAHSLEVRTPFVDETVLQTCLPALAHTSHPADRHPKWLLRQVLDTPLPDPVVTRKKQGFTFPWQDWMTGQVVKEMRELTHSNHPLNACLCVPAVEKVVRDFESGRTHWRCLWSLFVLFKSLQRDILPLSNHSHKTSCIMTT
jgi:asparagine synthase (glutamine-hydrolysing)